MRNRVPRDKKDLEDIYLVTHVIFPGGLNPRLEEIIQAVNPYWEVIEMHTRRDALPAHHRANGAGACATTRTRSGGKWGDQVFDDYDRYLCTCVSAFDMHYLRSPNTSASTARSSRLAIRQEPSAADRHDMNSRSHRAVQDRSPPRSTSASSTT